MELRIFNISQSIWLWNWRRTLRQKYTCGAQILKKSRQNLSQSWLKYHFAFSNAILEEKNSDDMISERFFF